MRSNSFFHSFPQIHYFSFVHITHGRSDCSRLGFTAASGSVRDRWSYRSAWWCNLSLVWIPSGSTRGAEKELKEEELPFERQELGLARVSPWSQPGFCAVRLVPAMPGRLCSRAHLESTVAMKVWAGTEVAAPGGGVQPQWRLLGPNPGDSEPADELVARQHVICFVCFLIRWCAPWLLGDEPAAASLSDGCCSLLNQPVWINQKGSLVLDQNTNIMQN